MPLTPWHELNDHIAVEHPAESDRIAEEQSVARHLGEVGSGRIDTRRTFGPGPAHRRMRHR